MAPNAVIRAISNTAVNARQDAVAVPPHLQDLFRHHNHNFEYKCDRHRPITLTRPLILKRGGFLPFVLLLLATVLGSLGFEYISRLNHNVDQ